MPRILHDHDIVPAARRARQRWIAALLSNERMMAKSQKSDIRSEKTQDI